MPKLQMGSKRIGWFDGLFFPPSFYKGPLNAMMQIQCQAQEVFLLVLVLVSKCCLWVMGRACPKQLFLLRVREHKRRPHSVGEMDGLVKKWKTIWMWNCVCRSCWLSRIREGSRIKIYDGKRGRGVYLIFAFSSVDHLASNRFGSA